MSSGIDVSDLVLDPDVGGQSILIGKRPQKVNNFGESVDDVAWEQAIAAVYPTGNNSLVREEAYQNQTDTITVVTKSRLNGPGKDGAGKSFNADLVQWQGNVYVVKQVNKFSAYGPGFTEAECSAIDYNVARN